MVWVRKCDPYYPLIGSFISGLTLLQFLGHLSNYSTALLRNERRNVMCCRSVTKLWMTFFPQQKGDVSTMLQSLLIVNVNIYLKSKNYVFWNLPLMLTWHFFSLLPLTSYAKRPELGFCAWNKTEGVCTSGNGCPTPPLNVLTLLVGDNPSWLPPELMAQACSASSGMARPPSNHLEQQYQMLVRMG